MRRRSEAPPWGDLGIGSVLTRGTRMKSRKFVPCIVYFLFVAYIANERSHGL